jgi:P4 family phage/plasmid primase-like protien
VYGYANKPYPKISAGVGVCEVKSEGTHGIMYCTNSIHKNGHRYQIIGTLEPTINEELVEHICHISGNGKDYNNDRIPVKERAKQKHYAGNNRHEELLVYIESLLFNDTFMAIHSEEEVKQYAHDYNNKQNVPPLDDKEFDSIWHDAECFVNKKTTEQEDRHGKKHDRNYEEEAVGIIEEASKAILRKHRILTVEESKEILYYHNGVYVNGDILIEREAEATFYYQLSTKAIAEIKGHIMRQTYHKRSEFDSNLYIINLKNRLYNILTGESKPHTPDYFSISQKPILYDTKAKSRLFGKYLNEILYPAENRTAVEIMAYTFHRDNPFEIISILFGYGANGKSVFTGLLTCLHGIKNVSNVPLNAIIKNPFALSDLENKDVNIDTELSSATIHDTAILKKLTGRQPVRIERKNQRAYDVALHAKLFFSANKIPQTADESDAYFRRNVVISFPNKFDEDKADPDLLGKLTTDEEMFWNIQRLNDRLKTDIKQQSNFRR